MWRYVGFRLLQAVPVVFLVTLFAYLLLYLIPGDPATVLLGPNATPEQLAATRERLGLNASFPERYIHWLGQLLHGDLGMTYTTREPVADVIARALPITLQLAVAGLLVALVIAIPVGIASGLRPGSKFDRISSMVGFANLSVPQFWLGISLVYVFSVRLHWFPATGYVPLDESVTGHLRTLVLPAIALGAFFATELTRYLRAGVIQASQQPHVMIARSRGLRERTVVRRHIVRNALIPFITALSLQFALLLGGAAIIEMVFAIPGMGQLGVRALSSREYDLAVGIVLVIALVYVLVNVAVDVLHRFLDPRLRDAHA
jgi:peptide/nickel transport system permease protein